MCRDFSSNRPVCLGRRGLRVVFLAVLMLLTLVPSVSGQESYASREDRAGMPVLRSKRYDESLSKLQQVITVDLEGLTLRGALHRIADKGGLKLSYAEELFPAVGDRLVRRLEDVTVLQALHEVLRGTAYRLSISPSGYLMVYREAVVLAPKPAPVVGSGPGGTIAGRVTDLSTGEALPGVNVVIAGTTTGATTDVDGYYVILNVPPGTYTLRASFIGYASHVVEDVRVNIDLTTEVDFVLQEETVGLDEVVVTAVEPVVKRDISANVANINAQEMENLPVASVEEVIGLQAGIEPGMSVRGSNLNELNVMVDGLTMRDGRNNRPYSGLSYTSVQQVKIQTGGFNAEYGNVRSGLVSVVTREGPRDRYTADILMRYSGPSRKNFGGLPSDPDAYWMRPFLDDAVALKGTRSGGWDIYTQRQYPEFEGWESVAANNNITPEQAKEIFLWHHRKDMAIHDPDYTLDASFGGPVPGISKQLGNLRFFGSVRQVQEAYLIPQMRSSYRDRMAQLKVTSDLASNMKLQLTGMFSKESGVNPDNQGFANMIRGDLPNYPWSNNGIVSHLTGADRDRLFANDRFSQMDVTRNMLAAQLTHTLNSRTFYQASIQRMYSDYLTGPGRRRDTTTIKTIGGIELDEAPFGYMMDGVSDWSGLRLGGHWANGRDSSNIAVWTGRVDVTSQLNQFSRFKTGVELIYSNYDMWHGEVDSFFVNRDRPKYEWNRSPIQGAAYVQNTLEFQGMVANIGVRLDYFDPNGSWFDHDAYDRGFSPRYAGEVEGVIEETEPKKQVTLSPRLGVAFPITEKSKLFFNYGHFRQMLDPTDIFVLRRIESGAINWVGNPNHPMPTTVAYELGYEHNLLNQFLLRVTGYYKALGNQPRNVTYSSIDQQVIYEIAMPQNYEDIRGFEATLTKNRGWVRGFLNYTYMAVKRGDFGFDQRYENRVQQRQYERETRAHYQQRPVSLPYARFNLEVIAPQTFGPKIGGFHVLGDWRVSLLGNWRAGQIFTWDGDVGGIVGLRNNIRWKDYFMADMRLNRNFHSRMGDVQLFVDISNVFNIRHLHRNSGFEGPNDFNYYMWSLHLPESIFDDIDEIPYAFIPGNDRPGDYRKPGVEFQPIEIVKTIDVVRNPQERPLYYETESRRYMWWKNGSWSEADKGFVDQVLEDKAYIDMPNESYHTFLSPRDITLGIRITF